jgi:hypothetical protein
MVLTSVLHLFRDLAEVDVVCEIGTTGVEE